MSVGYSEKHLMDFSELRKIHLCILGDPINDLPISQSLPNTRIIS